MSIEKKERPQDFLRRALKEDPDNFHHLEYLYKKNFQTVPHLKVISRIRKEWLRNQQSKLDPLERMFGKRLLLTFFDIEEHQN